MNATPANKSSEQMANEPSMEEILASIRRIISDDKMLPLSPKAVAVEETHEPEVDAFVMAHDYERPAVFTAAERTAPFETPALRVLQGGLPKMESSPPPPPLAEIAEPAPAETTIDESARPATRGDISFEYAAKALETELAQEPLISPAADASVASSFQALANTIFLQNTGMVEQTLRDLLRPMLKQWLDQNLPPIVERLVRAEIERVARGGR